MLPYKTVIKQIYDTMKFTKFNLQHFICVRIQVVKIKLKNLSNVFMNSMNGRNGILFPHSFALTSLSLTPTFLKEIDRETQLVPVPIRKLIICCFFQTEHA